jgi:hypothetical protein
MTEHLSYTTLCDAADKSKTLQQSEWRHLHDCDDCMLRLANLLQVNVDLAELRKDYPAA